MAGGVPLRGQPPSKNQHCLLQTPLFLPGLEFRRSATPNPSEWSYIAVLGNLAVVARFRVYRSTLEFAGQ